jgi:nitrile hydratase accessory protein
LSRSEPRLPPGVEEPVFAEPWQAQAFAMTVALHRAGLFTWKEWAEALSKELNGEADGGHDYYEHWLAALEMLISTKGVTDIERMEALTAAWHRAAQATPHGKPILLENDPEASELRQKELSKP